MSEQITLEEIAKKKRQIEKNRPLVHCITNIVTVNDCANILLAVGASPTMAHHPMEVEEVAKAAGALVINMGAMESLDAIKVAGIAAKNNGVPIVLDPVGASGASFRRNTTIDIIETVKPDCIRGNLSEIMALALDSETSMGVDNSEKTKIDFGLLTNYSKKINAVLVVSGEIDYIIQNDNVMEVHGGSAVMSKITGAGCMATVIIAAFMALEGDTENIISSVKLINECAKRAEDKMYSLDGGTMTFRLNLIDEVYKF